MYLYFIVMTTKELIFNQGVRLFALHGYQETTIRMICKEIGINEGSLYNHYKGKKELLNAIMNRCEEVFVQNNPEVVIREKLADTMSLAETLYYLVEKYISIWDNNQEHMDLWQVINNEQFRYKEAGMIIIRETKRRIERLTATFDQLQRNKKMLPCNSSEVAMVFIHAIRSQHLIYIMNKLHMPDEVHSTYEMIQTSKVFAEMYKI